MSDHLHYIEHRHEAGYGIKTTFTCKGDRTSPCHQYPPADSYMETWGEDDRDTFVAHDECWVRFWMEDGDCAEKCGPGGEHVRSGPIIATFNGDCAEWEYADKENTK